MGFTPGDFNTKEGPLHWELKDRGIVLWNLNELKILAEFNDPVEARKAAAQLSLLIKLWDGED